MEITKEVLIRYLNARCTSDEEDEVGKWLVSSAENTRQAMIWVDELSDQQEKLLLRMVLNSEKTWKDTVSKIDTKTENERGSRFPRRARFTVIKISRFLRKYAAIWVSALMLFFAYYLYHKSRIVDVDTAYGETKVINLPDGSKVTLNGKSSIRYAYGWTGQERRVWVNGEAFFKVRQLEDNATFKVYLSGDNVIEVHGTEFNVVERQDINQVLLKSGKIVLRIENEKSQRQTINVAPGELVEVNKKKITKSHVDPEVYISWAEGTWVLRNTTLQQILEKVKLRYGISVITSERHLSRRASGYISIESKNAEIVITDIAHLFNLKMKIKGEEILLGE